VRTSSNDASGIPQSLDGPIRFAIAHKQLIEVGYNGVVRLAEPHDYGVINGVERLFVFQRRGRASNRSTTAWRMLDVPKIESLKVLGETFQGSRGASHQHHHAWDVVYARVG
jgi:hypothetical protein